MRRRALTAPAALPLLVLPVLLLLLLFLLLRWHAPGSRYVSWLPSFSVEVRRVSAEPPARPPSQPSAQPPAASQLEAMARQVQQVFPQFSLRALSEDLALTRSPDRTVDNILAGRLPPPRSPPRTHEEPPEPRDPAPAPEPAPLDSAAGLDQPCESAAASLCRLQFSASAAERQRTLQRRKEQLLAAARRRYLLRDRRQPSATDTITTGHPHQPHPSPLS